MKSWEKFIYLADEFMFHCMLFTEDPLAGQELNYEICTYVPVVCWSA